MTSPSYYKNINFGTKLHFHHFSSYLGEKRGKGSLNSVLERESYRCNDFDHQNNRFELRKIFNFELILSFEAVFVLLEVMNWFNKVFRVFSRCFWLKIGF
jgi:hypothetical protein